MRLEQVKQAKRYAKLMGVLYILIFEMQAIKRPISYAEIERIMSQQQHCSPVELMQVCQELHRFATLIGEAEKGTKE